MNLRGTLLQGDHGGVVLMMMMMVMMMMMTMMVSAELTESTGPSQGDFSRQRV